MAYTIGHVVLGIDLTQDSYSGKADQWADFRDEISEHIEGKSDGSKYGRLDPTKGFEAAYSGGGEQPQWFGVTLGEFDECSDIDGEKMIALCTASQEKMVEYADLVGETNANTDISVGLRAAIASHKAKVIILWGTS